MTDNPIVLLEKVEKWFGQNIGLQDISIKVDKGEFLILLGRNGAGKSTLLRILTRLSKPNSGRVQVCGMNIQHEPEHIQKKIGFVGHHTLLYAHLTARENLHFYAKLYELKNSKEQIKTALKNAALEFNADRPVRGFSRGMQQRLAIARATLHHPELILLDEPYTGLDLESAELLSDQIQQWLTEGRTIIMATHDLEQYFGDVSKWVLLDKGQIVETLRGNVSVIHRRYRKFLQSLN